MFHSPHIRPSSSYSVGWGVVFITGQVVALHKKCVCEYYGNLNPLQVFPRARKQVRNKIEADRLSPRVKGNRPVGYKYLCIDPRISAASFSISQNVYYTTVGSSRRTSTNFDDIFIKNFSFFFFCDPPRLEWLLGFLCMGNTIDVNF